MKKAIIFILILSLTSCKMLRKVKESDNDTTLTEQTIQKTTRLGDTVRYTVPKITFRDTTIYSVNRQGTTLRTVFNEQGNVSEIECLSSRIDELIEINRGLREIKSDREVDSEKETKGINLNIILIGAMAFVFLFAYKKF